MFFTFFRYHLNKSRGSHNCRCRCCILPLQHLGLHTSVRGKPQLTTWKNDSPVSCVFIRTAFLDFCWSDVGWKPSNQILLRRFQIAKALPRLLRYLLPLWRGRVLRNHGLVNDFLLWAVYTHCHDVFYMLGYLYVYLRKDAGSWKAKVKYWNPLKNCFLGSLASGWRNTQSTSSFLRVAVQLVANFSLGAVFQSSQKATLKRFDTWSLRLILLDAPAGKTRLETPFVMTATLNSHILMQVPIHIWMPEVQQISATVKQNHWISASNSSNRFAIPDFGGHGEAELTWSLGIRRITSRNMVMPRKNIIGKAQGKDMETIGIKWNPCISMYPPIFGQKSLKVQTRHVFFFLLKGQISLGKTHNISQIQRWGSLLIWIPCMVALLGVCWALLQQEATHKELTILVTGGDGWGRELNGKKNENHWCEMSITIRFYHFEQLPHVLTLDNLHMQ